MCKVAEISMSKKIYKHNPIIRGHFTDASGLIPHDQQKAIALGEFEMDLFDVIYFHAQQNLWHADPDMLDYVTLDMRYSDIKKFMGIRSNDFKAMVVDALTKLKTTDIVFKTFQYESGRIEKNLHISLINHFAEEVNFDPDIFSVDLNPIMSRSIAHRNGNFTFLDLTKKKRLSGKYTKRLYEWLLSMKQISKEARINLDDTNKLFGMEESDFKQANRVLKRSYDQLNEMVPFTYTYDRSKKELVFSFLKKGE